MSKTNLSWEEALGRLQEGNARFVSDKLDGKLQDSGRREELTGGQHSYAIILNCADTRVVPELASIEYAVAHLWG